jgi:hypothetical protein
MKTEGPNQPHLRGNHATVSLRLPGSDRGSVSRSNVVDPDAAEDSQTSRTFRVAAGHRPALQHLTSDLRLPPSTACAPTLASRCQPMRPGYTPTIFVLVLVLALALRRTASMHTPQVVALQRRLHPVAPGCNRDSRAGITRPSTPDPLTSTIHIIPSRYVDFYVATPFLFRYFRSNDSSR